MKTTLTFKTFEQWKKDNADLEEELEDCLYCDGEGTHTCSCGDEHDCGECYGTGHAPGTSLETMFRKQYERDKARLEKWTGQS